MVLSRKSRGFTLIEIALGLLLIGGLATGAIWSGVSWFNRTKESNAIDRARAIDVQKQRYLSENGDTATTAWTAAPNDEARYVLLKPLLTTPPALLGDGIVAGAYSPTGFRLVLNGLSDPTTVLKVGSGAQVYPAGGSTTFQIAVASANATQGSVLGGGTYQSGETVTVNAIPFAGYTPSRWEEGGTTVSTDASYSFFATANRSLTAVFAAAPAGAFQLTVLRNNTLAGTVTPSSGGHSAGTNVTLTASTYAGWVFAGWTGDIGGASAAAPSIVVTMDQDRTVQANFVRTTVHLTVISGDPTMGSVSGGGDMPAGTTAIVTATAYPGINFVRWLNGATVVGTTAQMSYTVSSNATLTAEFSAAQTLGGGGSGTYGDNSHIPQITVDSRGLITSIQNVAISPDATGVTAGTYGSASSVSRFTVNQYGNLTSAANVPIVITESQVTGLFGTYVKKAGDTMSGSLGIGVAAEAPLTVSGGAGMTSGWNRTAVLRDTYPVQVFNGNNSRWAGFGYDPGYGLRWWVNATSQDVSGTGLLAASLLNNGNFGVGVTTPGTKLDVGSALSDTVRSYGGFVGNASANIAGTGAAAYFPAGLYIPSGTSWLYGLLRFNGTLEDNTGGTYWSIASSTGAASFRTLLVNGGTTLPLTISTSSGGPWAINLARSDIGFSSQVYNDGTRWYFQHRPSFAGNIALDAGNYNSYAPSLTGANASGTWGINISGNSATTSQRTFGNVRTDGVNRGSYGSISVAGSTNGYSGIDFTAQGETLMVLPTYQGIYEESGRGWLWRFDNGSLAIGTVPWGSITGRPGPLSASWTYSGQSGQPTWLWGTNDGNNMYVWNPSNFNVSSAETLNPHGASQTPAWTFSTYNGGSFIDAYSGGGLPPGAGHVQGINMRHVNYSNSWGWQMASQYSQPGQVWARWVDAGSWSSWYKMWTEGNDGSGTGLDADLLDGYHASTGASANTIVQRDGSGHISGVYGFFSYLNMSHGLSGSTTDTVFYSSGDDYIRKNSATGFRASLNVPTRTGGDASGTWPINITGSASYAGSAGNANTVGGYTPVNKAGDTMTGRLSINQNWGGNGVGSLTINGNVPAIVMNDTDHGGSWAMYDDAGSIVFMYNVVGKFSLENNGHGHFTGAVDAYGFNNLSSRRYKTNFKRADVDDVISKALQLDLTGYNYLPQYAEGKHDTGLIAEEVAPYFPDFVAFDKEGKPNAIDYGRLGAAVAVSSAKVFNGRFEAVSRELARLGKKLDVTPSSERFKRNVKALSSDELLGKALKLKAVEYDYIPEYGGTHEVGLLAEQVQPVMPATVSVDEEGKPDGVKYGNLAAVIAVGAVQALNTRDEDLSRRTAELTNRLDRLERADASRAWSSGIVPAFVGAIAGAGIVLILRRRF